MSAAREKRAQVKLSAWDKRLELAERLAEYDTQARAGLITVEAAREAPPLGPVELPPDFTLWSELPKGHPARRDIRSRGFSPAELSRVWGVGFSAEAYHSCQGRLVIPLRTYLRAFKDRREVADHPDAWGVVGYQGRALSDEEKPKYLTSAGTPKSQLLYGLDQVPCDADRPVVVCEGPADVWRAGPGTVALLGKTASEAQCKLLRKMLPGRDVVIVLDPDAATEALAAAQRIRGFLGRDLSGVHPGRVGTPLLLALGSS